MWQVPFNALRLAVLKHSVPQSQMLVALNGQLVALCRCVDSTAVPEWLAYGFVHSINIDQQCLYVNSPISVEALAHVNAIIKGDISLPVSIANKVRA